MPETPTVPTPEQVWRWMTLKNIRISVFGQPTRMSWSELDESDMVRDIRIESTGEQFYVIVRQDSYMAAGALFKGHSYGTPLAAYNAGWEGMLRWLLHHPEEWPGDEPAAPTLTRGGYLPDPRNIPVSPGRSYHGGGAIDVQDSDPMRGVQLSWLRLLQEEHLRDRLRQGRL